MTGLAASKLSTLQEAESRGSGENVTSSSQGDTHHGYYTYYTYGGAISYAAVHSDRSLFPNPPHPPSRA